MAVEFEWSNRIAHGNARDLGIARVRRGRGFSYTGADGSIICDTSIRSRIAALAIPPAWENVKIATSPHSHMQAVGIDQRHRQQYRYHPVWIQQNKQRDFDRLPEFARSLPKIRDFVDHQLCRRQLDRDRVLGIALRLLDKALVRVGNDRYATENGSFGLTTLRDSHVKMDDSEIHFEFVAKGGLIRKFSINDPKAVRAVRACHELPGYRLLQYLDAEGDRQPLSSTDINRCLAELTGTDFTAKTFRTWGATTDFHHRVYGIDLPVAERDQVQALNQALRETAKVLGNTLAVCRKYYVHPRMISGYLCGDLAARAKKVPPRKGLSEAESDAVRFLDSLP